jgi:hypothetical protein
MIEDAMVDASVSCTLTADVWKKHFRGKVVYLNVYYR